MKIHLLGTLSPPCGKIYKSISPYECRWEDNIKRIILKWIFRKLEGVMGTGWCWLRIGTVGGHLWVR